MGDARRPSLIVSQRRHCYRETRPANRYAFKNLANFVVNVGTANSMQLSQNKHESLFIRIQWKRIRKLSWKKGLIENQKQLIVLILGAYSGDYSL